MQPFLSIIIPAYNEAERLPLTLVDIDKKLSKAEYSYEILVVNDGSKDKTAEAVRGMQKGIKNLKLIDNEANKGKGGVVRQGMLLSRGQYRLFTDADNSTSIDHFNNMLPYFKEGYDVVICSRTAKSSKLEPAEPFYRQIFGKGINLLVQALLLPGMWDTQCGFKAFTAEAAEKIFQAARIPGWSFDVEILSLAKRVGCKIKEIPVHWVNESHSRVKFSSGLQFLRDLVKIRWWLWTNKYQISGVEHPELKAKDPDTGSLTKK